VHTLGCRQKQNGPEDENAEAITDIRYEIFDKKSIV